MHAVRQEHDVALAAGIEPQRRAGEPGVPERSDRKQLAAVGGVRRVDVPAEAANVAHPGRRGRRRHARHRRGGEDADIAERSAVQQHAAEPRQVRGGAEESGVSGDAVHASRRRIVDDPAQKRRVDRRGTRPLERRAPLGRRDSRAQRFCRQERGVFHPERFEDVRLRKMVEALTADASNDLAEHEEVDVAVDEALAGRGGRHLVDRTADRFVRAVELDLELEVGAQPGRVRQEMPDRDAALCRAARNRG